MIVTSKSVLNDLIRTHATKYWFLFPPEGTNSFRIADYLGASPEEGYAKLDSVLTSFGNKGRFLLVMTDQKELGASKIRRFDTVLDLKPETTTPQTHVITQAPQPQQEAPTIGAIDKMVEERLEQKLELIELQNENKRLQDKLDGRVNNSALTHAVEMIKPYLPALMRMATKGAIKGAPAIAGTEIHTEPSVEQDTIEMEQDDNTRLMHAIKRIFAVAEANEKDALGLFEKLATALEQDPTYIDDFEALL